MFLTKSNGALSALMPSVPSYQNVPVRLKASNQSVRHRGSCTVDWTGQGTYAMRPCDRGAVMRLDVPGGTQLLATECLECSLS